jgi:hypothetical protein
MAGGYIDSYGIPHHWRDGERDPYDFREDPKNRVSVLRMDGTSFDAILSPGNTMTRKDGEYRKDIGFFRIRYKICQSVVVDGRSFSSPVYALLNDGLWRLCNYNDLVDIAISTGATEK